MLSMGIEPAPIFAQVDDLVVRTMIAVEDKMNANISMYVPHRGNCYELWGFDVMLDSKLHPWIIEVCAHVPCCVCVSITGDVATSGMLRRCARIAMPLLDD